MATLIFASTNAGKIKELTQLLQPFNINIISQATLNIAEIAETGASFVENALIKARHAASCAQLPALADDSGLEIDALGGRPGIYSARYSGGNDADNMQKVLHELQGVPDEKRTARFKCALVYVRDAKSEPVICEAVWEGLILQEPCGVHGFGYDPIFYVPTHNCSAAQLSSAQKNSMSHRAKALRLLEHALLLSYRTSLE